MRDQQLTDRAGLSWLDRLPDKSSNSDERRTISPRTWFESTSLAYKKNGFEKNLHMDV